MRQNYLWTKKLVSAAEDDNLHLNFEPVLSRLMGAQLSVQASRLLYAPLYVPF